MNAPAGVSGPCAAIENGAPTWTTPTTISAHPSQLLGLLESKSYSEAGRGEKDIGRQRGDEHGDKDGVQTLGGPGARPQEGQQRTLRPAMLLPRTPRPWQRAEGCQRHPRSASRGPLAGSGRRSLHTPTKNATPDTALNVRVMLREEEGGPVVDDKTGQSLPTVVGVGHRPDQREGSQAQGGAEQSGHGHNADQVGAGCPS